jgi:hypothetical protein
MSRIEYSSSREVIHTHLRRHLNTTILIVGLYTAEILTESEPLFEDPPTIS